MGALINVAVLIMTSLPSVIKAVKEVLMLIHEHESEKKKKELIAEFSDAVRAARKEKDTSKLEELINGKPSEVTPIENAEKPTGLIK